MRFTPKSEEQLSNLLPDGNYDFEIIKAEDTTSKNGNDMIVVTLKVFADDGSSALVFDYLLEAVLYKIAHIAAATGLQREYDAGELTARDLQGQNGRVKIATQAAQNGFPVKNVVKDYLPPVAKAKKPREPVMANADLDDDIPF